MESKIKNIPFEPHKLARSTDPDTSYDAAVSMHTNRVSQHQEIMRAMKSANAPMTAENIGDVLNYSVWRRMTELEEADLIVRTDQAGKHTATKSKTILMTREIFGNDRRRKIPRAWYRNGSSNWSHS